MNPFHDSPQDIKYWKTYLNSKQLTALRRPIIEGLYFLEKNKMKLDQADYKDLFNHYQHILNTYNNMIDRNTVQSNYIDPRTVVQVQPIVDGKPDYDLADWERQFTANNINLPATKYNFHPPLNRFREVRDYKKYYGWQNYW